MANEQATLPHVIIVGGGFGGLAAGRALKHTPARVTLIDKTNHHVFQPLLYQVATSAIASEQIAAPIRHLLRGLKNTTVLMGEVTSVDAASHVVHMTGAYGVAADLGYDYLILATGATGSYFGHDEWAAIAPYPKTVADALMMRDKMLTAFEYAELEGDPAKHRDLLTFALVGPGPTGVEMAGALAAMTRSALRSEYRHIDPTSARIILVDAGPRILGAFAEELSRKTHAKLTSMGVEIRSGTRVEHVDADGVNVNGERIASRCVFWTAGVHASPAGKWLGAEADHAGRVQVLPNLSVPGHPEVFVVGDTARIEHEGKLLPGVAQVAMQSGHYAGKTIDHLLAQEPELPPFKYLDKGNLATVSMGFAVLEKGPVKMSGLSAKFVWAFVHLAYLSGFESRFIVLLSWLWAILTRQRGARVIEDPSYVDIKTVKSA